MNTVKPGLDTRLAHLIRVVDDIAYGRKPHDYPAELFTLLQNMKQQGFITEAPESYVTLPHEDPQDQALMKLKGHTGIRPISKKFIDRQLRLAVETQQANIYNYKLVGMDQHFHQMIDNNGTAFPDPVDMAADASALIMARGDIHTLRQGLHLLQAKLDKDVRTLNTTLIIQNTQNGFWSPLLDYLGFKTPRTNALEHLGIYITKFRGTAESTTPDQTLSILKNLGEHMQIAPRPDRFAINIQPGDMVLPASGSAHKPIEIGQAFEEKRAQIIVAPLSSRIDIKPREAEEDNYSYAGNNLQKADEIIHTIKTLGEEAVIRMICPAGKGPENIFVLCDDRGFNFLDQRIMRTAAFAPTHSQLNPLPYKCAPGAELAPVLKTHSRKAFFEQMLPAAIAEINNASPDNPADNTVLDTACHVMFRLDWLLAAARGEPLKYVATMATRRSGTLTSPKPAVTATQTDHYMYPLAINDGADEIRTKAEIDRYITTGSELADSLDVMYHMTGMNKHAENLRGYTLSKKFARAAANAEKDRFGRPKKHIIATLYSLFPSLNGHGSATITSAMNGAFKLMSGRTSTSRYSLESFVRSNTHPFTKTPTRMSKAHSDRVESALSRLRNLYQDADGFVFTPDSPALKAIPGLKWLKSLFYFSLVVGKQVDDRAIKAKFVGHLADTDNAWGEQRSLFDYLAQTPVLLNRYEDVMQDYQTKADLKEGLRAFNTAYARPSIPDKDITRKTDGVQMPDDMYRVTIYCSASLGKDTDAVKESREFTFNLAQEGYGIINGGGREGLMVATSEGVHAFRAMWAKHHKGKTPPRTHVTSYQCHDTYEREGGWHEKNDDAVIYQTIEQRMANLMNTDAEILMAGGSGSIQEIMASLLMREWNLVPTRNRPFIVINQKLNGVPVFDEMIKNITASDRKRLNIHVVDNIDQAHQILNASRAAMQKELGEKVIYTPKSEVTDLMRYKPEHQQRLRA